MKTRVENGLRKVLIFGLFLLSFANSVVSQRQNGFSLEYGADQSSTNQFELRPNCLPGEKLVEKPEGYICMEDIRRNRYQIQRNGPCENSEEVFQIDPNTRQVSCVPRKAAKSKRIFDVLPSNMRHTGGSLEGSEGGFGANMLNCLSGSNKCSAGRLGRGHISTIADPRMGKRVVENDDRKMAAHYIKWIRSFIDQV